MENKKLYELRKNRLVQVRKQAKEVASDIRSDVQKKREQHLDSLKKDVKQKWYEDKETELLKLERCYQENLQFVGNGWKDVQYRHDLDHDAKEEKIKFLRAAKRGVKALSLLREQKALEKAEMERNLYIRKFALDIEKERAAMIASLPSPEQCPIDQILATEEINQVVLQEQIKNPTFSYLWASGLIKKADIHESKNARNDALIEMAKYEKSSEDKSKMEKERIIKSKERFKSAWRKECLLHDYACAIKELEEMERKIHLHNKWATGNNVMQSVCPPIQKKIKEEKRLSLQNAVERTFHKYRDEFLSIENSKHPVSTDISAVSEHAISEGGITQNEERNLIKVAFSTLNKDGTCEGIASGGLLERLGAQTEILLRNDWKRKRKNGKIHDRGTLGKLIDRIQEQRKALAKVLQHENKNRQEFISNTEQHRFQVCSSVSSEYKSPFVQSNKKTEESFQNVMLEENGLGKECAVELAADRKHLMRQDIIHKLVTHNQKLQKLINVTEENCLKLSENIDYNLSVTNHLPTISNMFLKETATADYKQIINNSVQISQGNVLGDVCADEFHASLMNIKNPCSTSDKPFFPQVEEKKNVSAISLSDMKKKHKKRTSLDHADFHLSPPFTLSHYIKRLAPTYFQTAQNSKLRSVNLEACLNKEDGERLSDNVISTCASNVNQSPQDIQRHSKSTLDFSFPESDYPEKDIPCFQNAYVLSSTPSKEVDKDRQNYHDIIVEKLRTVNQNLSEILEQSELEPDPVLQTASANSLYNNDLFINDDYRFQQCLSTAKMELNQLKAEMQKFNKPPVTVAKFTPGFIWAPHELSTIPESDNISTENTNITAISEIIQTDCTESSGFSESVADRNENPVYSFSKTSDHSEFHLLTASEGESSMSNENHLEIVSMLYQSLMRKNNLKSRVSETLPSKDISSESFKLLPASLSSSVDSSVSASSSSLQQLLTKSQQKEFDSSDYVKNISGYDITPNASGSFQALTLISTSEASLEDGILEEPDLTLIGSELSINCMEKSF